MAKWSCRAIRTINQKVRNANDQHGEKMEIVAKLIDNRLVIESATSGIDPSGEKKAEKLTMSESDQMYLPRTYTLTDTVHIQLHCFHKQKLHLTFPLHKNAELDHLSFL